MICLLCYSVDPNLQSSGSMSVLSASDHGRTSVRIALLHLAPMPGALARNRLAIETAIVTAARAGATWIITPELSVCGYTFADTLGTDWIAPRPDGWMTEICRLAAKLRVTVVLSHPERDAQSHKLFNTVFAIADDGSIAGKPRKINTLHTGSEAWSTPGVQAPPISLRPFGRVGILIRADAFTPGIAGSLKTLGAELLVSSAAWAPGLHGPNGEWERCTRDTGLPLLVCNRTGPDRTLNFIRAESVVAKDGRRLPSMSSERAAVFAIDWDLTAHGPASQTFQRIDL